MFDVCEVGIASIKVGDRARKSTGDVESLRFSIERNGLLNPITVDENYNLAAGERRLRACEALGWDVIPCRIIPGLTAENLPLIEWIENVEREGFTWIEDLELKAKMHALWKEEHGQWGYRDTAARMGVSLGGLSSDLALADALQYFPELKEYKTKSKARDGYKKLNASAEAIMATKNLSPDEQAQLEKMLANSSEKAETKRLPDDQSAAPTPPVGAPATEDTATAPIEPKKVESEKALPEFVYEIMSYESLLAKLPAGVVGFAELDPPYAIDYAYHDESDTELDNDWTLDQLEDAMDHILRWLSKNMLENSWVLCWTGYEHTTWINELAKSKGFGIQPPGIWHKPNGGRTAVPSVKMQSNYESFLIFRHGKATFNTPSFSSVVSCESVTSGRVHKWEKPIDLYRKFFTAMGRENLYFLSPFAGSGNAMVTSTLYGMTPVGCDTSQKHFYSFYNTLKNYYMEVPNG